MSVGAHKGQKMGLDAVDLNPIHYEPSNYISTLFGGGREEQDLSLNQKSHQFSKTSWSANPSNHPVSTLPLPQYCDYRYAIKLMFNMGPRHLKSCPYAWTASTLSTNPPPHPMYSHLIKWSRDLTLMPLHMSVIVLVEKR